MRQFLIIGAIAVAGCTPANKVRSPEDIVESWQQLGMYLPPAGDVRAIRNELPASLNALRKGLSHEDGHVRMDTAYVIEELGSAALSLVPDMRRQFRREGEQIVRVYLASAFATASVGDRDTLEFLEDSFAAESDVQAKTYLAGALVRLSSPGAQANAWDWLLDSLKAFPPEPPAEREARDLFWERRWGAVAMVRHVHEKDETVLPLLKALESNPRTPGWVIEQQVSDALQEIQGRASRSN